MPDATQVAVAPGADGGDAVAGRASRNTAVRAAGDLLGKVASLVLVFALARETGPNGLGAYVLAFAWAELALTPVQLGLDRWLVRQVAEDRRRLPAVLPAVLRVQAVRAVPVLLGSTGLAVAVGYDRTQVLTVVAVSIGVLLDAWGRTVIGVFTAFERGELVAATVVFQRFLAAALGLAALAAGFGVVAVAVGYAVGAAGALAVGIALVLRRIARVPLVRRPDRTVRPTRQSLAFAAQELASMGIARADTLLLSLLATTAAVGAYGAGYRLLEATLFLSSAVTAACSAMFTYLGPATSPTVGDAFERALKAVLAVLLPVGLLLGLLAEPIVALVFGDRFGDAVGPLRLLAPVVVLLGVTRVCTSLLISRDSPAIVARAFAVALVWNIALNVALIPSFGAAGAAAGMLGTYVAFSLGALVLVRRRVGPVAVAPTFGAAVAAGVAMAAALLLLAPWPLLAGAAGVLAYVAAWAAAERRVAPADLAWVVGRVAGVLRRVRPAAAA